MSAYLAAFETRLVDILENARGQSGLGAVAAARYIPAARFRRTPSGGPIDDPGISVETFDRAYEIEYLGIGQVDDPHNQCDGRTLHRVPFRLRIGYVRGPVNSTFSTTTGTESASTNVVTATRRAIEDARRIERALCFADIYGATSDDPQITMVVRVGETSFTELGDRVIHNIPFLAMIHGDNTSNYDP